MFPPHLLGGNKGQNTLFFSNHIDHWCRWCILCCRTHYWTENNFLFEYGLASVAFTLCFIYEMKSAGNVWNFTGCNANRTMIITRVLRIRKTTAHLCVFVCCVYKLKSRKVIYNTTKMFILFIHFLWVVAFVVFPEKRGTSFVGELQYSNKIEYTQSVYLLPHHRKDNILYANSPTTILYDTIFNTYILYYTTSMPNTRRNLQHAIQLSNTLEMEMEMDIYLQRSAEQMKKLLLQHKISRLVNDPNCLEIVLKNQQNGVVCTQNAMQNMVKTNEIYKKLNRKTNLPETNTPRQTI